MTNSLGQFVRTCVYSTLLAGVALPMGIALAQEEGAEPSPIRSLEPVRLYVKSLDKSGQLRK
ncbi:MAG: hypothetical protein HY292_18245, partial [Planctomycetes bacterium]|nr:hypothetical protein [Planctomycetota bacterium]